MKKLMVSCFIPMITLMGFHANNNQDYIEYHKQITEAETLLSEEKFGDALTKYRQVFEQYDFVFMRDYKVAIQIAFYLDDKNKGFDLLRKGMASGWTLKGINKNDFWMSTIISHHNSISREYARKDTLYSFIKPELFKAIKKGEMSPYEYALADDWYKAVVSERTLPGYGFLTTPKKSTLSKTNQLREKIGLRSIELRNKLVEVERKTGMEFYLPDWIKGQINIE